MEIGTYQTLKVLYRKDFGVFLGAEGDEKGILLPKSQVPEGIKTGDTLTVFVYKDSEDRVIATMKKPKLTVGEIALLTVREITKIGAFLDWGMDKDLLLPYKEQQGTLAAGQQVLAAMYVDHSGRLCATMRIYKHLRADSPYQKGDMVNGTVYGINPDIGIFVAVDNRYYGMLPKQHAFEKYRVGDAVRLRVTEVRQDGKLNLSEGQPAYQQMEADAERVLNLLAEFDGVLPFGEKASPEVIKRELSMSKAAFKRALGHLYKAGKIEPSDDAVRLK